VMAAFRKSFHDGRATGASGGHRARPAVEARLVRWDALEPGVSMICWQLQQVS